jgi:hypothetical protein
MEILTWGNHGGLTDTNASDKATCVDLSQTALVCHKNDDAQNPDNTELAGSPQTSNSISKEESQKSACDGADLNHSLTLSVLSH